MALDMWMREDIRNILLGLEMTSSQVAANLCDNEAEAYRQGFRTALAATAVSFGIALPEFEPDPKPTRAAYLPRSSRPMRDAQ